MVAVELELPHEPDVVPAPPSVNEPEVWVKVPRLATEPEVIEKIFVTVSAELKVTAPPELLKVRLETVPGKPFPVF